MKTANLTPRETAERGRHMSKEFLKGRELILAVLERAAEDTDFQARLAENATEALADYYTLTSEECAALACGDIRKIEKWVGKLDKRLSKWLWARLQQESW
ncbi:MAG: hypothetical protein IBX68_08170 [Dehalococcoidia bacterium]|nr:hypothetical protein [Dehalococcoidia bacterium]